jgi:4-fold beta-flower domain-containing protein
MGRAVIVVVAVAIAAIHAQRSDGGQQITAESDATPRREFSLFDSGGRPVAYIAEDLTLYLWSGTPAAYLGNDRREGFNVYGFNGKHLGWLTNGVIRDHDGNVVGAFKEAFRSPTKLESAKGLKEQKPIKSATELEPAQPLLSRDWSELPLGVFLLQGVDD